MLLQPSEQQLIDLRHRFIINLPQTELISWNRLWYHVELAYYYWLDYFAQPCNSDKNKNNNNNNNNNNNEDNKKTTPHLNHSSSSSSSIQTQNECVSLTSFCHLLLTSAVPRVPSISILSMLYKSYLYNYKYQIPVAGIILRAGHQVLLVKNESSQKWGFPKGKLNKGERPWDGALRELEEETGVSSISSSKEKEAKTFVLDSHTLKVVSHDYQGRTGTTTLFYLTCDMPNTIKTRQPKFYHEIIDCQWINISAISSLSGASAMLKQTISKVF